MLRWWNEKTGREDGNLLFVLLFMIFAVGVVIVVTATVIASTRKTAFANNYTVSRTWADAGVNDALWTLNNPGQNDPILSSTDVAAAGAQTSSDAVKPYDEDRATAGDPLVKQGCTKLDESRYTCWRWWIPTRYTAVIKDGQPTGEKVLKADTPPMNTNEYLVYSDAWIQSDDKLPALTGDPNDVPAAASNSYRKVQALLSGISTVAANSQAAQAPFRLSGVSDRQQGGGQTVDGRIIYDPAPPSTLTQGLWTRTAARLNGGVAVTSYDSKAGSTSTPTGHGVLAAGGTIDMDGSVSANKVRLYGADIGDFADRCMGPLCTNNLVLDTKAYSPVTGTAAEDQSTAFIVADSLPSSGLTALSTSDITSGTVLGEGTRQYRVDGDLTIPANTKITLADTVTSDAPVEIFVKGDVVIGPGSSINMPSENDQNPLPGNLVIYSAGDSVTVGGASAKTQIAASLYAPRAACSSGSSAGVVDWFGSLACNTFSANAAAGDQNWHIFYDDQLGTAFSGTETPEFRNVWSMANIIERTPTGGTVTPVDPSAPTQLPSFSVDCDVTTCTLKIEPQVGVTSFDLYRHAGPADANAAPDYVGPVFSTLYVDKFLAGGTRYEYVLYPKNVFGIGPAATRVGITTPVKPAVSLSGCTETTCDLNWNPYAVEGSTFQWTLRRTTVESGASSTLLTNKEGVSEFSDGPAGTLEPGTEYEYALSVRATAADSSKPGGTGLSKQSEPDTVIALTLPAAPVLVGEGCTTTTCELSWNHVKSATSYDIYRQNDLGQPVLIDTVAYVAGDTMTYTDTDLALEQNKKYFYSVKAHNRTGNSQASNTVEEMTLPLSVNNEKTVCEETTCALTWEPNNKVGNSASDLYGVLTYIVEYREVGAVDEEGNPNDTWNPIATVSVTEVTKANLQGGTNYEFRITAKNDAGNANPLVAPALTKPEAPEPTSDCSLENTCVLTWKAVKSVEEINPDLATGYRVERFTAGDYVVNPDGTKSTTEKWVILDGKVTANADGSFSYADTTLAPAMRYRYRVFAFNASGDSLPGYADGIALPAKIKPTISCKEPRSCVLTWDTAGSTITKYTVWRGLPGGDLTAIWSADPAQYPTYAKALTDAYAALDAANTSGDSAAIDAAKEQVSSANNSLKAYGYSESPSTYTDKSGLDDGTDYIYAVTASAGFGDSKKVEVPALTVPAAPVQTAPTVCTDIKCTVSYSKPKSTTYFLAGTSLEVGGSEITTTVTDINNLEPGMTVGLRVSACNASGCGDALALAAATRPAGPLITGTDGWSDYDLNEFRIEAPMGDPDNPTDIWRCTKPGVCASTDFYIGAINGAGYVDDFWLDSPNAKYCYTAVNNQGESVMSCKFTPPVAPVVTNLNRADEFLAGDTLRVLGPADTYVHDVTTPAGTAVMNRKPTNPTDGLIVNGLKGNTQYCFTLRNIASDDTGRPRYDLAPYSSTQTCAWTVPDAPTNLTATRNSDGKADLNWVAPSGDISDYIVEYKLINDTTWGVFPHAQSNATAISVGNLNAGATYMFRVKAVNPGGAISAPSNVAIYQAATTPGKPTALTTKLIPVITGTGGTVSAYTSKGTPFTVHTFDTAGTFTRVGNNQKVYLTWVAPLNNGGSIITDYTVEYRPTGSTGAWTLAPEAVTPNTFATITVPITQTYDFQVTAKNSQGPGVPSDTTAMRVNFPTEYINKGRNTAINTNGDPVQNASVATDICPANMTLQANGSCREITPASQTWQQTGWSCNGGDANYNNGTCRHSQGYNETYQTGTETYACGSHCEYTRHWGSASCTRSQMGICTGWACPGGWTLSGTSCYTDQCDRWVTDYCSRPTYGTRWVDTSYNYSATAVYGWVNVAVPAGWSGTYPAWYRDVFFNADEMKAATWTATPEATPAKGTGPGDSNTYYPGSVTVRYPTPFTATGAVQNLAATIDVSITGGTVTSASGYTIHTFRTNGTMQITPGTTAGLTWTAPSALGRGTILDYSIDYREQGTGTWINFPHPASTQTAAYVTGLNVAKKYEFQVTPVTEFGLGTGATAQPTPKSLEYLIVGGGAGGGTGAGGGGGAGGVLQGTFPAPVGASTYSITVGAGGAGSAAGTSTTMTGIGTAIGGGPGGSNQGAGTTGASGGGGSFTGAGAAGTPGQGNAGSQGAGGAYAYGGGGGGGGAGGAAPNASTGTWSTPYTYYQYFVKTGTSCSCKPTDWSGTTCPYGGTLYGSCCQDCRDTGYYATAKNAAPAGYFDPVDGTNNYYRIFTTTDGPGGAGISTAISGVSQVFGQGGGGGSQYYSEQGASAPANTGNGGDGSASGRLGGSGGSGIVVVRYTPTAAPQPIVATGGSVSIQTINGVKYKIHAFSNTAAAENFTITSGVGDVEYLIIGGGAGGGGRNYFSLASGGGGAGGVNQGSVRMTSSVTPITVGAGGTGGPGSSTGANGGSGGASTFGSLSAFGGGGGARPGSDANSGGSGGGGAQYDAGSTGGSPLGVNQGNNGASTAISATSAGGGGGFGSRGLADATGGTGLTINFDGSSKTFAVGGNGGNAATGGAGAFGGSGGKGGTGTVAGSAGGQGAVYLRYPTP